MNNIDMAYLGIQVAAKKNKYTNAKNVYNRLQ